VSPRAFRFRAGSAPKRARGIITLAQKTGLSAQSAARATMRMRKTSTVGMLGAAGHGSSSICPTLFFNTMSGIGRCAG